MTPTNALPTPGIPPLPFALPGAGAAAGLILLAVFLLWALFTIVNFYHWFRYSRHSLVMLPALVAHIFVSTFLLLFAGIGTILH